MVVPASSSRGMRMKKMAKMMPRNSTMVSVRQTGSFSLRFQGLFHLDSARSHSRSSATIIRFSTKAMQMPMSSGASRENRLEKSPPMVEILYRPQNSSTAKVMSSMMRCMVFLFRSMAIRLSDRYFPYFIMSAVDSLLRFCVYFCPLVSFRRGWYNRLNYKQEVRA